MTMNRRRFVRNASLLGGAGLLGLAGGTFLWQGCAPPEEEELNREEEVSDDLPAYARLHEEGELERRVEQAFAVMEECYLCPRECGVNRREGETGFCRTAGHPVVFSRQPHFGEERPLVGANGSGTIFFSNCNLRCVFCQNYPLAHKGRGREATDEELAQMMMDLQDRGCHNINLVTPTHVMPNIISAVHIARQEGLELPLVYNTSGYENAEMIEMLDGVVDIYLPDMKFMDGDNAERYNDAEARDYPEKAQRALIKMHRQVGDLVTDERGIAERGLMVRHLVMPNRVAGTREFVDWVAENLSTDTYVNIMAQYRVEHRAYDFEKIDRAIHPEEFIEAVEWAEEAGLTNLDERSLEQLERMRRQVGGG